MTALRLPTNVRLWYVLHYTCSFPCMCHVSQKIYMFLKQYLCIRRLVYLKWIYYSYGRHLYFPTLPRSQIHIVAISIASFYVHFLFVSCQILSSVPCGYIQTIQHVHIANLFICCIPSNINQMSLSILLNQFCFWFVLDA